MRRGLEEEQLESTWHIKERREKLNGVVLNFYGLLDLEGKAKISPHKNALTRKEDSDSVSLTLLG